MICTSGFSCHLFFLLLATCLRTLNICELAVDDTVNGEDNMEEKTSEVADIRRYHFNWNFSTTQDVICCCDGVRQEGFFVNS